MTLDELEVCPFCGREKVEWISVNEAEKPEHREVVLAYVAQTKVYFIALYNADRECFLHKDGLYLTLPTHWKRIEPPKGE